MTHSTEDRYERQALLEYTLRRLRHPLGPDLAIHRRLSDAFVSSWGSRSRHRSDALYAFVASLLDVRGDTHVLDVGCGFGAGAAWVAAHTSARRVTGVSSSRAQLRIARKHFQFHAPDRLDYIPADFNHHVPGTYGAVYAVESIIHAADLSATMRHLRSAMVTGARLVLVDDTWVATDLEQLRRLQLLGWGLSTLPTEHDLTSAVTQSGFDLVDVQDLTGDIVLAPRALSRTAARVPVSDKGAGSAALTQLRFWQAQLTMHDDYLQRRMRYLLLTAIAR